MQKNKTLSCLQDNVFLIVFQWLRKFLPPCTEWYEIPGQGGDDFKEDTRRRENKPGKTAGQSKRLRCR